MKLIYLILLFSIFTSCQNQTTCTGAGSSSGASTQACKATPPDTAETSVAAPLPASPEGNTGLGINGNSAPAVAITTFSYGTGFMVDQSSFPNITSFDGSTIKIYPTTLPTGLDPKTLYFKESDPAITHAGQSTTGIQLLAKYCLSVIADDPHAGKIGGGIISPLSQGTGSGSTPNTCNGEPTVQQMQGTKFSIDVSMASNTSKVIATAIVTINYFPLQLDPSHPIIFTPSSSNSTDASVPTGAATPATGVFQAPYLFPGDITLVPSVYVLNPGVKGGSQLVQASNVYGLNLNCFSGCTNLSANDISYSSTTKNVTLPKSSKYLNNFKSVSSNLQFLAQVNNPDGTTPKPQFYTLSVQCCVITQVGFANVSDVVSPIVSSSTGLDTNQDTIPKTGTINMYKYWKEKAGISVVTLNGNQLSSFTESSFLSTLKINLDGSEGNFKTYASNCGQSVTGALYTSINATGVLNYGAYPCYTTSQGEFYESTDVVVTYQNPASAASSLSISSGALTLNYYNDTLPLSNYVNATYGNLQGYDAGTMLLPNYVANYGTNVPASVQGKIYGNTVQNYPYKTASFDAGSYGEKTNYSFSNIYNNQSPYAMPKQGVGTVSFNVTNNLPADYSDYAPNLSYPVNNINFSFNPNFGDIHGVSQEVSNPFSSADPTDNNFNLSSFSGSVSPVLGFSTTSVDFDLLFNITPTGYPINTVEITKYQGTPQSLMTSNHSTSAVGNMNITDGCSSIGNYVTQPTAASNIICTQTFLWPQKNQFDRTIYAETISFSQPYFSNMFRRETNLTVPSNTHSYTYAPIVVRYVPLRCPTAYTDLPVQNDWYEASSVFTFTDGGTITSANYPTFIVGKDLTPTFGDTGLKTNCSTQQTYAGDSCAKPWNSNAGIIFPYVYLNSRFQDRPTLFGSFQSAFNDGNDYFTGIPLVGLPAIYSNNNNPSNNNSGAMAYTNFNLGTNRQVTCGINTGVSSTDESTNGGSSYQNVWPAKSGGIGSHGFINSTWVNYLPYTSAAFNSSNQPAWGDLPNDANYSASNFGLRIRAQVYNYQGANQGNGQNDFLQNLQSSWTSSVSNTGSMGYGTPSAPCNSWSMPDYPSTIGGSYSNYTVGNYALGRVGSGVNYPVWIYSGADASMSENILQCFIDSPSSAPVATPPYEDPNSDLQALPNP